jgi:hypothetical protein
MDGNGAAEGVLGMDGVGRPQQKNVVKVLRQAESKSGWKPSNTYVT